MKKKILVSGAVLLSIYALAGCGQKSTSVEKTAPTTAVSTEKTEVVESTTAANTDEKAADAAENSHEEWTLTADGKYKYRTMYRWTQEEATRRFEADQKLLDTTITVDGYSFNLGTESPADLQAHLSSSDYVKTGKEITDLSIDLTEHKVTFDGLDVNDYSNAQNILDYCKENKNASTNPMGPKYIYGKDIVIEISSDEFAFTYTRAKGEYVDGFNIAYDGRYTFNLADLKIGNLFVLEHLDEENILADGLMLSGTNDNFEMYLSEDGAKKLTIYKSEVDKTEKSIAELCAMTDDEFSTFADQMGFTATEGKDSAARYAYKQDQDYVYQFCVKKLTETNSYYTQWIVGEAKNSNTFARHGGEPELAYRIELVD